MDCPPTFTMYEFDAAVNGALVVKGTFFCPLWEGEREREGGRVKCVLANRGKKTSLS